MGIEDRAVRRKMEKEDEERYGITAEETEDYIDDRSEDRNEYDKMLEGQIVHDELTGLTNRKGLMDDLEKTLKSMRQPVRQQRLNEQPALQEFSLLSIDLDNFKGVNDALGHAAGDSALKKVAEILKYSVREADVVARLHGDEFAIFLPRANTENARTVAEKILQNLESDSELQRFGISASIGVRHIDKSSLTELITTETLIHDADLKQATAKQAGKGRIETHQEP
jgi:diguanylate cyclase (GGDEF)-like protein